MAVHQALLRLFGWALLAAASVEAQAMSCAPLQHLTFVRCVEESGACTAEFQAVELADKDCRRAPEVRELDAAQAELAAQLVALARPNAQEGIYRIRLSMRPWGPPPMPTAEGFLDLVRESLGDDAARATGGRPSTSTVAELNRVSGGEWLTRVAADPTDAALLGLRRSLEGQGRELRRLWVLWDIALGAGLVVLLLTTLHLAERFFAALHSEKGWSAWLRPIVGQGLIGAICLVATEALRGSDGALFFLLFWVLLCFLMLESWACFRHWKARA